MKHFKFLAFLMMMVAGLSFGFASCGDDDDDDSTSDTTISEKYNSTAVAAGEAFYKAYEEAETTQTKTLVAATYALTYATNKNTTGYQSGFWVGVAAQKFGYTDNLDKAAEHVGELDEIKNIFDTFKSEGVTTENVSETLLNLLNSYVSKNS